MANVQVKLNLRALNQLMTSEPVQREVDARGQRMAAAAGEGFEYSRSSRRHPWVARGYVQVNSAEGARRQAEDAVLERSIDAGR
ncbi:hypothetical protein [Microbacterium oxydans]|uniref:hypothetical protein n=1 Tax=Microbacterium oxydans TaxID=82380 RepID=UPI000734B891|nr:hypothetical protein [Microbacterium oxydans]KTR77998.1 hypothetical protein NS234_04835 [Microbacterium oxydans]